MSSGQCGYLIIRAFLVEHGHAARYDVKCVDEGKIGQCYDRYNLTDGILGGIPFFLNDDMMQKFCGHIRDILPCLRDVFEPCTDPYYDFTSYSRTFQKACNDRQRYMNASISCLDQTTSVIQQCLRSYHSHIKTIYRQATPKTYEICTVLTLLRGCMTIEEKNLCDGVNSAFLTELYRGRFLPATCDHIDPSHTHVTQHPTNMASLVTSEYCGNTTFGIIHILVGIALANMNYQLV